LSQLFLKHANVLVTALFVLAALVVLRLVLRKPWLALVAWALLIVLVSHPTGGYMGWALGLWVVLMIGLVYLFLEFGWLGFLTYYAVLGLFFPSVVTLNLSSWHARRPRPAGLLARR